MIEKLLEIAKPGPRGSGITGCAAYNLTITYKNGVEQTASVRTSSGELEALLAALPMGEE